MAKNSSEVKRTALEEKTKIFLWGMTAGRCEICNKLLYIDSKFGDTANFARKCTYSCSWQKWAKACG